MKNNPTPTISICFIGGNSLFSFTALKTLCEKKLNITEVILPGHAPAALPASALPVSTNVAIDSVPQLASNYNIPITYLGLRKNRQQQWQQLCDDTKQHPQPDYVFVACFPEKLPAAATHWPHQQCVNLHPSLLPKYRGPDPLFWQLRNNEQDTGFTLHEVIDELDAGPVVHQQAVALPVDATHAELNTTLARQGAQAFAKHLATQPLHPTQQDNARASYDPLPMAEDYRIDPRWSAAHAFRFIRGTQTPIGGYPISLADSTLYLTEALSFNNNASLTEEFEYKNDTLSIRFTDGVLLAKSV